MKILISIFFILFLFGCLQNHNPSGTSQSNIIHDTIVIQSVIKQPELKEVSKNEAKDLVIKYLLDRGAGKSCLNSIPKENIKIINQNEVTISANSFGDYSKDKISTNKVYIYLATTRECYSSDKDDWVGNVINRVWGLIQDANTGEVIKEITTDPEIVGAWLTAQVNMLYGIKTKEDSTSLNQESKN
jgi:hypothetical protein